MTTHFASEHTQARSASLHAYARLNRRRRAIAMAAALALCCMTLVDLTVGSAGLSPRRLLAVLGAGPGGDTLDTAIVWSIRLPMTATCLAVGASLGLAGLLTQTLLSNPLASPFTLGIAAASGFGASLALLTGVSVLGIGWLGVPLLAMVMAMLACVPIYWIGRTRGMQPHLLILVGIVVLFLFQALQSLMQFLAAPEVLQQIVFWLFGSLLKASWNAVSVAGTALVIGLAVAARKSWALTALSAGDENAENLGVPVDRLRRQMLLTSALLTAGAVSFVGTIGFVGLVAPHVARLLAGDDQRYLIVLSPIVGALLLCAASVISKLVLPGGMLPIGIVTALVGAPFLFYLVMKKVPA